MITNYKTIPLVAIFLFGLAAPCFAHLYPGYGVKSPTQVVAQGK